jgi:hypothetical protein
MNKGQSRLDANQGEARNHMSSRSNNNMAANAAAMNAANEEPCPNE